MNERDQVRQAHGCRRALRAVVLRALLCAVALAVSSSAEARKAVRLPIRNVIFDMGDVLLTLTREEFRQRMTPIAGSLDDPRYRAIVESFETGRLREPQFWAALRALRPQNKARSDAQLKAAWSSQVNGPMNCKALALARQLKRQGYKTYVLSTNNPVHARIIEQRFRACFKGEKGDVLPSLFDHIYYTQDLGLLKPDPAIYRRVVQDARLDPKQTLFLDDLPENVLGAQLAGLYALLVRVGSYEDWLPRILSGEL